MSKLSSLQRERERKGLTHKSGLFAQCNSICNVSMNMHEYYVFPSPAATFSCRLRQLF